MQAGAGGRTISRAIGAPAHCTLDLLVGETGQIETLRVPDMAGMCGFKKMLIDRAVVYVANLYRRALHDMANAEDVLGSLPDSPAFCVERLITQEIVAVQVLLAGEVLARAGRA